MQVEGNKFKVQNVQTICLCFRTRCKKCRMSISELKRMDKKFMVMVKIASSKNLKIKILMDHFDCVFALLVNLKKTEDAW